MAKIESLDEGADFVIKVLGVGSALGIGYSALVGLVGVGGATLPFSITTLAKAAVGGVGLYGALDIVKTIVSHIPGKD